ncbi:unnamed protein product [Sphagnum balticum]
MEQRSTIWWESTWSEQFLPCFWLPYPYVWLASTWHPSLLPLEKTLLIAAGAQAYGRWLVALPSALMMCLEQWRFQILTLLVKLLPNTEIEMAAVIIEYNVWGHAFSKVQEVLDCVSRTTSYLAVLAILNCCQTVLARLVRGVGWQKWAVYANLGTHYGIGLPIAIILVLVFHFDGRGLRIGMLSGVAEQTIALTIFSLFTNWENLDEWKTVVQGKLLTTYFHHNPAYLVP